jgi:hypothetical protein
MPSSAAARKAIIGHLKPDGHLVEEPAHHKCSDFWYFQLTKNTPATQNAIPRRAIGAIRWLKRPHAIKAVTGGVR